MEGLTGDDLISRAAAHEMVKGLQEWCITLPGNPRITQVGYMSDEVLFGLDRLPAVDAVPAVHGRWVIDTAFGNDVMSNGRMVLCSECGQGRFTGKTNYCPNCGAKMDGGVEL